MKTWALVILAVGMLVLLASLGADVVGLGSSPEIFGYKQMAGAITGIVLALVGAFLYLRSPKA
jgi:hypothetical protein